MEDELGIIMFEGKMYNLDKMTANELEELITKMKLNYNKLQNKAEILSGIYN